MIDYDNGLESDNYSSSGNSKLEINNYDSFSTKINFKM